jgi:hypothetical protein
MLCRSKEAKLVDIYIARSKHPSSCSGLSLKVPRSTSILCQFVSMCRWPSTSMKMFLSAFVVRPKAPRSMSPNLTESIHGQATLAFPVQYDKSGDSDSGVLHDDNFSRNSGHSGKENIASTNYYFSEPKKNIKYVNHGISVELGTRKHGKC